MTIIYMYQHFTYNNYSAEGPQWHSTSCNRFHCYI